jgi:sec-independent protein translocase protein TatC
MKTSNPDIGGDTNDRSGKETSKEMSFVLHIEELRRRLILCVGAVVLCAIPCGIFWREIFDFIAAWPLHMSDPIPKIIFTAPTEAVVLSFKIAVAGGVICASPLIFQQIWGFISPGLYKKERAVILAAAFASTVCFLAGITFSYFLLPYVLQFLTGFAEGQIEPYFKVNEYFSFLIRMCFAFGIAFELPVLAFILTKMGVISHRFLIRYFRYAIVAIFIAAAILTPPDILSQVLLALPLLILYALSILISFLSGKKEKA